MSKLNLLVIAAAVGFLGYTFMSGDVSKSQTADLGQVLDRTAVSFERFDGIMKKQEITELGDAEMDRFTTFYASVLNEAPAFYDSKFGVLSQSDGSFIGFSDTNANSLKDQGEEDVFKVEVDSANNRFIITDSAGTSSHTGFSGSGFLAGALMGHMLTRQRSAGIKPGSFNDRKTTPRQSYKAPTSARSRVRSGGVGFGK